MARDPRRVFLVGFMGAGKTTVGRLVASALGWPFLDSDEEIVRREGRDIDAIFRERGEGYFRGIEWEVLQQHGAAAPAVLATGGGLFLGATQRRWMKARGVTVWLDPPLEVCEARVGRGSGRPLWQPGEPLARRALFEKRRACYALAELRLDPAGSDPAVAARQLAERLDRLFRSGHEKT